VVFSGVIYTLMSRDLEQELAEDSAHDIQEVLHVFTSGTWESQLAEMPEESREFNLNIKLLDPQGNTLYLTSGVDEVDWPLAKEVLADALKGPVWSNEDINGVSHLVLTHSFTLKDKPPHYYLQVANSRANINRIRDQLVFCINVGTPLILIFAVFMGRLFAKKALAPVEQIRARAQTIESDSLRNRLEYDGPPDELYRLTETLNDMLGRIQKAMSQMKRFVADASHELRIPLTGLRGTVEVAMRQKRSVEEHEQILETVHREAERMSELVWDLLSLARADAGELKLEKTDVDLEAFMKNVFEEAQALNAEKKIHVRLGEIAAGNVAFDEVKIHQLLINLIENAIRYNKPGGEIVLSSHRSHAALTISVKDNGMGIAAEDQEKIFERFYRVDKARSREAGGTGLGLSIARSIAEAHKGTLTVRSTLNEGSEFTLSLPLP
jgi:heavy metal sensor kinase